MTSLPRILVIDDDSAFRTILRVMLETAGYEVQDAADGKAGVARYRQERSDVVLMDILMPEQEGLQTIRELLHTDPQAKIIAMSAGGEGPTGHLSIALRFGARRTLRKPFSRTELLAALTEVLGAEKR
jgi:CheY-like chemotaxis protein